MKGENKLIYIVNVRLTLGGFDLFLTESLF